MRKREGNRPDRRIVAAGSVSKAELDGLLRRVRYAGSSVHKLHPADYGLVPPVNPRPSKSVCDDVRVIPLEEASRLFATGIEAGMISRFDGEGVPKYVWAVDADHQVYEAKTTPREAVYHGYRLGDDEEAMRRYILGEWGRRCPKD